MTRVLHFFKTYLPDGFAGVERVIWALAEGAASSGMDVDVLSLSPDPLANSVPIGQHFAHKAKLDLYVASTGFSIGAFKRFSVLAAEADVLHYHFPWPFMDMVHLATGQRKPSVVTYHSDIVKQRQLMGLYAPLMHAFLDRVDVIVATSPNYLCSSTVLHRHREKTVVIPIGIPDLAPGEPDPDLVECWRARVGSDFFLFCGALRYYKGLHTLIDAARQSGLPVVIAGKGDMASAVEQAGLPNIIHVPDFDDADKAALLLLSLAFVFPSHLRSEAYGLALAEAAMAGRPMISCELGTGTSYVNRNGETGLVVPPDDATAFAAAMATIGNNRALARAMGAAARRHYEKHLTSGAMVTRYLDLYRDLAGRGRGGSPTA